MDALLVWEQGYEHALHQSTDLKQLLELEELFVTAKQGNNAFSDHGPSLPQSESDSLSNGNPCVTYNNQIKFADLCSDAGSKPEICLKSNNFDSKNELHDGDRESYKSDGQMNASPIVLDTLSYDSESCSDLGGTSESCGKVTTNNCDSNNGTKNFRSPTSEFSLSRERKKESRENKKFRVARISDANSITIDFQFSRGIAEVCFSCFYLNKQYRITCVGVVFIQEYI